ncbi:MAG: single-stranded-DNA-specific exonuclease RecJ [Flavobacteriales bacterium]
MQKQWIAKSLPAAADTALLQDALNVPAAIAKLLMQRGIHSFNQARSFFRPVMDMLHDPFLMKDMDKAVNRLTTALHNNEKILVYGDYDVDGTTSVTVVFSFLKSMGAQCDYYIPDRYTEGYGFSHLGVQYAHEHGFKLIITLDCGIKDADKVKRAAELGIDVIICDHHQPGILPQAVAVLDTLREDCTYPYKGLSGCGVGFKLLQGFARQQGLDEEILNDYLDLVTIAIGADIVPMTGENRILAYHGMQQLQTQKRPGIQAMLDQSAFKKKKLTIADVVFILAPRINAAGRIYSGRQAVELLLAPTLEEAAKLSPALESNNNTRRDLDKAITNEAIQFVDNEIFYQTSYTTVVSGRQWHKGVVGIVASRLVETYYKPAIVLVESDEKMAGSARSIPGIDLFEALGECSDLLEQFGGHTMAAGLSLKPENFEPFRQKFDTVVARLLNHKRPEPCITYDLEMNGTEVDAKFYRLLSQFAPFGPENMRPLFLMRGLVNAGNSRRVGDTGTHLKMHLKQSGPEAPALDGIGFDLGNWAPHLAAGKAVDILFNLEENEFNGRTTLQLNVKDIRASEG